MNIDDTKVMSRILNSTLAFAVPMIAINLVVVLLEVGMLRRDVSNPAGCAVRAHARLCEGDSSRTEPLKIGRDDEIGEIADSYNQMTGGHPPVR